MFKWEENIFKLKRQNFRSSEVQQARRHKFGLNKQLSQVIVNILLSVSLQKNGIHA